MDRERLVQTGRAQNSQREPRMSRESLAWTGRGQNGQGEPRMVRESLASTGRAHNSQREPRTDRGSLAWPGRGQQDTHKPLLGLHQGRDRPLSLGWGQSPSGSLLLHFPGFVGTGMGRGGRCWSPTSDRNLCWDAEQPMGETTTAFPALHRNTHLLQASKNQCVTNPSDPVNPPHP